MKQNKTKFKPYPAIHDLVLILNGVGPDQTPLNLSHYFTKFQWN